MNRLMLLAAGAAALTLTACHREVHVETEKDLDEAMRVVEKLDCPETQGQLTRVSAEADGTACAYTADGAEVTLQLVALDGKTPDAALAPIETGLKALIPPPAKTPQTPKAEDGGESHGDRAEIQLPGLHIRADDDGANIVVGSIKVDADDDGAQVRVGDGTIVNAGDEGAEIRTSHQKNGFRSTYVLAADETKNGYDVVGYEARGPSSGPLVVAVVKAKKDDDHNRHNLFEDVKDLVKLNVGD